MAIEIVSFPINSMVIFQSFLWLFTRGYQVVITQVIDTLAEWQMKMVITPLLI